MNSHFSGSKEKGKEKKKRLGDIKLSHEALILGHKIPSIKKTRQNKRRRKLPSFGDLMQSFAY